MSIQKIIRAWKDEGYRESLNEAERNLLPEHPAGLVELRDEDLGGVSAGMPLITKFFIMSCLLPCLVSVGDFGTCF